MLRLVVDNSKKMDKHFDFEGKELQMREILTCRNNCDLFDEITGQCPIKQNVNVDSPFEVVRCGHFVDKSIFSDDDDEELIYLDNDISYLFDDDEDFDPTEYNDLDIDYSIVDDDEFFHEFVGNKFDDESSTYPLEPDYPSKRDDAIWYVSPDKSFGCYIINHYKKPMNVPKSIDQAQKGWTNRVYKSPVPLHNHETSLSLASKIAWYVDEEGYGQYVLLVNGKISTIAFPKPSGRK